jgi:uncharacterized protein YoxC
MNEENQVTTLMENVSWRNKDIFCLFYFITAIALILMTVQYIAYFKGVEIQFTLENFAKTLNVAITIIGISEGIRSFTKSSTQEVGESTPVPAYKLRYLLSYILSFVILTLISIIFHLHVNQVDVYNKTTNELLAKPDFAYDQMTLGLLSNFVCYLIARYGDKISENIDLSDLSFFKKK